MTTTEFPYPDLDSLTAELQEAVTSRASLNIFRMITHSPNLAPSFLTMAADVLATVEPISVTAATEGIGTPIALGSGQRGYLARFEVNVFLSKCFWTLPAPLRGMSAKMNSRGIL